MNDANKQLFPVWLPRNEEEQARLSAAFAQDRTLFSSNNRQDKFEKPISQITTLKEGPCLTLVRESSIPHPEQNKDEFNTRLDVNDKDRTRGFPYKKFSVLKQEESGEKTLIADWENTGSGNILGNNILELDILRRLKPYFSSTLNQRALNGCLIRYLIAALSFYLPNASWKNVLGGSPMIVPNFGLDIVSLGENQFQVTFTQLGFKKNDDPQNEEYSDIIFSLTLNLTFGSAEAEMPSEVTLSKVALTPFSRELSKAIDAQKVLQSKLGDMPFIAKKLNDPIYCHVITSLIFTNKINLNKTLNIATPKQKIDLIKNIFGRQEFPEWFEQLPQDDQENLLRKASQYLHLSEKIKIYTQLMAGKVKESFAEDIGWNVTTENINELSDSQLTKVVLLDKDPQQSVLKRIIEDANKPIESYNFFERRFPRLFQRKRRQNKDIINKKYALKLLLSTNLTRQDSKLEETFYYLKNADNKKTLAEAFLSNVGLLDKLKLYESANDLLKPEIVGLIKNSEEFTTSSVSDLLEDGATATELKTFAKLKSGNSSEITLNETTQAIIKGASKQIKPLNFFERSFPRIFTRKARENKNIEVQRKAVSELMASDQKLAPKVQEKIDSTNVPWSEKFSFVDALPKSVDYIEQLKSKAKTFFNQALPGQEFIANAETYIKLTNMLPVGFQNMSIEDIKEGNTVSGIRKFFLGQYILLCLPVDALPKEEDFANDPTIQTCCELITKRIQQIKELLETLAFVATLEDSTPVAKQQIFDSALQNEKRRLDLANLAFLPNDPYGVRTYLEGKDTFNISVPTFVMPPFVKQQPVVAEEEMVPVPAPQSKPAAEATLTVPSAVGIYNDGSVAISVPAAAYPSSPTKILVGLSTPTKPVTKENLAQILQKAKTPTPGNTAPVLMGTAEKMKEELLSSAQLDKSSDGSPSSHESSPREQLENKEQSCPPLRRTLVYGSGSE